MEPIHKVIGFCSWVHTCYPSADGGVFAICGNRESIEYFTIYCSRRKKIIFESLELDEKYGVNTFNQHYFDFSPDNQKFCLFIEGEIIVYNFITDDRKIVKFDFKPDNPVMMVKFIDNETIIVLTKYHRVHLIKENKETILDVDKSFSSMNYFGAYLDRKGRKIMCLFNSTDHEPNQPSKASFLKIPDNGGEVKCEKIEITGIPYDMNLISTEIYTIISYVSGNEVNFLDLSNYALNGEYGVPLKKIHKKIEVCETLLYPIEIGYYLRIGTYLYEQYLFEYKDTLFAYQNRMLVSIDKRQFIPSKLAGTICGGFYEDVAWSNFLLRGLYDPRLFLLIYDFAQPKPKN